MMKNIIRSFLILPCLAASFVVKGQSFTVVVPSDTVYATVVTTGAPSNSITNITGSNLTLKWHVAATSFPPDWLTAAAFGICDNHTCDNNSGNTLWNYVDSTCDTFTSIYGANSAHDSTGGFSLSLDLTYATSLGSHWVTINVQDAGPAATSKNLTFIINKVPSAVPNILNLENNVALYPNPAGNELNIVYDANADIKNIAVYNIIGKLMTFYKVTANNSANLNLENIPSGIYFVRLVNAHGAVVATRKFTKQ